MTMDTDSNREMIVLKNGKVINQKAIIDKILATTRHLWYLDIPKQKPVFKRKTNG